MSVRNHRIVIASLFLPNTAVLGESEPPTPVNGSQTPVSPPSKPATHGRQSSVGTAIGPLKSIVEDLKDKTRNPTPAVLSPAQEIANPFSTTRATQSSLSEAAKQLSTEFTLFNSSSAQPPTSRKYQTTHTDHQHITPRVSRRHSRSSSRRSEDVSSSRLYGSHNNEAWHIEPNPHCNGGLKNAVQSVGDKLRKKLWVGTLGTNTDSFNDPLRKIIDSRMMQQRQSIPVWIPDAEFASCYDEFCHQVLWPCLHYAIPDAPKTKMFYESASYKQYVAVNQRFADTIIANYQDGDIIWVNDYHLMLVPQLLRASSRIPRQTPIGFFMHVAFPSSEIFRCLSVRQHLLRGLLGADLVGFQTANYARHFRQTVSRILAYEALPKGVQVADDEVNVSGTGVGKKDGGGGGVGGVGLVKAGRGRFVDVGVFPMGIDVGMLNIKKKQPEVEEWVQVLKQRYAGMKIIVGRDKLDEIQGVRHKLQAFETFLDKYPEFQGKVVLIQVALQTTDPSGLLSGLVADLVSRINSRYSTLTYQPIIFLPTQDLTFSQYLALLTVADAFVVTSLREGMALRTHEYVECQEGRYRPLVLSEFTGSYSYSGFRSCVGVNPWDYRGTAGAFYEALTMGEDEARSRWEDLHNHVTTQTAPNFITTFLTRLLRAHAEHLLLDPSEVPALNLPLLLPRWKHSRKRILLLDFEGTIWKRDLTQPLVKDTTELPAEVLEDLKRVTEGGAIASPPISAISSGSASPVSSATGGESPRRAGSGGGALARSMSGSSGWDNGRNKNVNRNEVWLLSGLPVKGVLEKVAEKVPRMGIVAENGCFIKTPGKNGKPGEWISMVSNFNLTWKTACVEILNYFTERTPGSFVEERGASVVWRFWTGASQSDCSDRQWARRQAAEAQNHIFDSLGERYGLRIVPGTNSFLVLPNNISRSTAVGAILHPGGPSQAAPPFSRFSWVSPEGNEGFSSAASTAGWPGTPGAFGSFGSAASGLSIGGGSLGGIGMGLHMGIGGGGSAGGGEEADFLMAISGDEKLLRRLNDFEGAETVSSMGGLKGRGTGAKWKLVGEGEAKGVVKVLAGC